MADGVRKLRFVEDRDKGGTKADRRREWFSGPKTWDLFYGRVHVGSIVPKHKPGFSPYDLEGWYFTAGCEALGIPWIRDVEMRHQDIAAAKGRLCNLREALPRSGR